MWKMLKFLRRRLISLHGRFFSSYYNLQARVDSLFYGGRLIASNVYMDVPVRTKGSTGRITLRGGGFGYRLAPVSGDGRILIQAREKTARIEIGPAAALSNNIVVIARVSITIGNNFLCGDGVRIMDSDFHELSPELRHTGAGKSERVVIGDNVWLGSGVLVLKGVSIGDHSVIAAGSVVTRSIPSRVIAAGNPAKIIRSI